MTRVRALALLLLMLTSQFVMRMQCPTHASTGGALRTSSAVVTPTDSDADEDFDLCLCSHDQVTLVATIEVPSAPHATEPCIAPASPRAQSAAAAPQYHPPKFA
jgi:hypothetical protein